MKTLEQLSAKPTAIPTATSWYLADLGEAHGRQELFTKQSPQRLEVLREHALIESAVSSNRIEGVTVDPARLGAIVLGRALLRDRNEEEVRGYRDALKLIHERSAHLPVSEQTILRLHRLTRGDIWDAGRYKDKDIDIIERDPFGHHRIRFKTVPATKTRAALRTLISLWDRGLRERWVPPPVILAGMNLDVLCIHPFRDGNGRVSRLLLLLQSYHLGYEVGRYISLERLIEQHKNRYYETLERSSYRWHDGKHDPWPYVNYLLFILKTAYREFEEQVGQLETPRGAKTELVESAIASFDGTFALADLARACPGVSRDMVRRVLRNLQHAGRVECLGRGPGAPWRRRGTASKRG
jgi:Fic family protein